MTSLALVLLPSRLLLSVLARGATSARRRASTVRRTADAGMSTAEYAVGTVAAVAFAVVLYRVVRSPAVSSTLASIITNALHAL